MENLQRKLKGVPSIKKLYLKKFNTLNKYVKRNTENFKNNKSFHDE